MPAPQPVAFSEQPQPGRTFQIVAIGEILWDVFPMGAKLGGAPVNFACTTQELRGPLAHVTLISAVGADELGQQAVSAIAAHGVDISQVQTSDRETGRVLVELDAAGVASYRFVDDTAWDAIGWQDSFEQLANNCDAVCFGTLGQRSATSCATIERFVQAVPNTAIKLLDLNLRPPFDDDEVIRHSLELANMLKLNDDELARLAPLIGLGGSLGDQLRELTRRYGFRGVAVTHGANGASFFEGDDCWHCPGLPVEVVDTVGAGDAYAAAMILGLLQGDDPFGVNQNAVIIAAHACTQPGGTVTFGESKQRWFRK